MEPTPIKPMIVIAQLEGSGTTEVEVGTSGKTETGSASKL